MLSCGGDTEASPLQVRAGGLYGSAQQATFTVTRTGVRLLEKDIQERRPEYAQILKELLFFLGFLERKLFQK